MQESLDAYAPELFHLNGVDFDDVGYRAPVVTQLVGVTYRQLDYWARTKLLEPSVRSASGSGTQRLYSFKDILVLKVIHRLLGAGVSLPQIRTAVEHLRARGTRDLAATTLISDGVSVYECTNRDEVFDLLRGGQGVFGIAVGPALTDLAGEIVSIPGEDASRSAGSTHAGDDLADRRARRSA
ncbi:MerR family transcriptional regulator [Gordonia alkanivorans]|uniref:MerR family transcriptional regulator n=1 Tax=Gordonia alkanivorans TaxID=84096 RepID=UPI0005A68F43